MDSTDLAYIQRLVGQPWQRGGLHCWALVVRVQRDLFGRDLPLMRSVLPKDEEERRALLSQDAGEHGWRETKWPEHGCVVRMYRPHEGPANLRHAGVWLDLCGGMVLHTDDPHGVVLDDMPTLRARGWMPRYFIPLKVQA